MVPAGDVYRDVVWHGGELDAGFIPLWMGLVEGLAATPPQTGDPLAIYAWLSGRLTPGDGVVAPGPATWLYTAFGEPVVKREEAASAGSVQ